MRLTHISVEGVGKFGTRVEVAGLTGGVNILPAINEAGKSTLFRAVRACLFERHNSDNRIIRPLATEGLTLPVSIRLGFDHDGQSYSVTKNFLRSPSATLSRGTTELARNKQADEMLWDLLGVAPGVARSVDEAAFGLLWVGQGKSFEPPRPSEAAAGALNAAIQAEVGTLVGGERARAVLGSVSNELEPLATDKGKPRAGGAWEKANRHLLDVEAELVAARARLDLMDHHFVRLAALHTERRRVADPEIVHNLRRDLDEARVQLRSAEDAASRVAAMKAESDRARTAMELKAREHADLATRAKRIDEARQREAEKLTRLADNQAGDQQLHATKRAEREAIAASDAAVKSNEIEERALEARLAALRRGETRTTLATRLQALESLVARGSANERERAANRATADTVANLDALEREIAVLTARMEAAAPKVRVSLGAGGAGTVSLDGARLLEDTERAVLESLTIQVGDLACITIAAPAVASDTEIRQRNAHHDKLNQLVVDAGARDAASLRADRVQRSALELEAETLKAELAGHGVKAGGAGAAILALRHEIAEIDASAVALAGPGAAQAPAAPADLRARLETLRGDRETARSGRALHEGRIDALNADLNRLASERGSLQGALTELRNQIAADIALLPDAMRAERLVHAQAAFAEARGAHEIKAAALAVQERHAPPREEIERLRARVARLGEAADNHARRLAELDREIANLEGQIQSAGGDGLGEKAATLQDERDLAARHQEHLQARVTSLQLLKSTIETCYAEQRDKLNEPLRRHLRPFLGYLFPDAELELGDGFSISGLRRGKALAERFEVLSGGTQEQIAVLVRLAMGAMLCERGQEVPIILDDSLAWCGDERIEQMFDAINRAGRNQQVIVLTCRTNTFRKLGGTMLKISAAEA